jgi:isopenicillin N synthase-like dioxygenase
MAAEDYKHLATISLKDFEDRKQEIAEQLFRSASTIGFFYIVGQHDVACCMPERLRTPLLTWAQPPTHATAMSMQMHVASIRAYV